MKKTIAGKISTISIYTFGIAVLLHILFKIFNPVIAPLFILIEVIAGSTYLVIEIIAANSPKKEEL